MFLKRKDKQEGKQEKKPKLPRAERKAQKLEAKKQKLLAPKQKKESRLKKHITTMPFIGSKIIAGFSGFLAASAFYQFEVPHDYRLAGILAGVTLALSVVSSAPYMKSVKRTNSTLAKMVEDMDKIDSAVGSQQQLISQVVSEVEQYMQSNGIAPEVQHIKAQLVNLQKSVDALKINSPQEAKKPDVHTAQPTGKKNVVAE